MILPAERVSPYLRALGGLLHRLAPHEDYVPLDEALTHLDLLSTERSGPVLGPAEVNPRSGMPSFAWMSRALAEQALIQKSGVLRFSELQLERARAQDPKLAERLDGRRRLGESLKEARLLPLSRLAAVLRRARPLTVSLSYDRLAEDGRWLRLRVELEPEEHAGLRLRQGRLELDEGLRHLLARHLNTPLPALVQQLSHSLGRVSRLSRTAVGPFWFPGVQLPPQVPSELGSGLLLHISQELLGEEVRESRCLDPLASPGGQWPGLGLFQQRRLAADSRLAPALARWERALGVPVEVCYL